MEAPEGNETVDELLSRCPSAGEIGEIDATISLRFENDQWPGEFTATPPPPGYGPFGPLVCRREDGSADLDLVQRRVYQAFLIIRNMEFDAPLPWTDQTLYEWLVDSIDGVRINPAFEIIGAGCCKPENYVVVSHAFWGQPDRWVDPEFVPPSSFNDFDPRKGLRPGGIYPFVVLLVHAARVNEVGGFNCSPYRDSTEGKWEFGYDQKLEELGPWGVEYWFLRWIAAHSDPSFLSAPGDDPDVYRTIAGDDAQTILETRFCDSAPSTEGPAALLELEAWAE